MDWIQVGTLAVSIGTLVKLFFDSHLKQKQIEKDRQISVIVDERRRMQRDLFHHVTSLLNINKLLNSKKLDRDAVRKASASTQNHQVNIWINLNLENKYHFDLKNECNKMATAQENFYDEWTTEELERYRLISEDSKVGIWALIEHYVREEEILVTKLLDEKKSNNLLKELKHRTKLAVK